MLDAGGTVNQLPLAIVVGRTLSTPSTAASSNPAPSYFVGEVQNNQVAITYTVYNEQADPESGVLLTTTLEPGVTFLSSSVTLDGTTSAQLPDQNGQNLAWSLGTINGYDRESVAVTVGLPNPIPLQLDSGAQAFAMLDAGTVSASTPAATLRPGNVSDPSLLASTVDSDTNDPFIQEEAAALNYDPTQIFGFLHTQIGYNSYLGSVRGARGTLWSNAGNALDVASLGVALIRASGIPAQYVSGSLSQSDAQELILSMFPAQYQTVGYIPAGTQVSDPANDPQLLSETESHYWFQFNTGSGMQDADPLIPGATIGQTFTTSTGTFATVPAALEETTEVQLVAEIYSQAGALFGQSGLQDTTVLDQTFDDAYLVGRPLSIANFVSTTSAGLIFTATTNTYTPYIVIDDEALSASEQPEAITGTPYQEVLTNFPLASQILTGLFLNVTLSGPGTVSETFSKTLVDRIGYAARQGLVQPDISVNPADFPIINDFDVTTLNILPGLSNPQAPAPLIGELGAESEQFAGLIASSSDPSSSPDATSIARDLMIYETCLYGDEFLWQSDILTSEIENATQTLAYFDGPRITITSSFLNPSGAETSATFGLSIDLLRDTIRSEPLPGQGVTASQTFQGARGLAESLLEGQVASAVAPSSSQQPAVTYSTASIFQAASEEGIPLVAISTDNMGVLDSLPLSAEAKARITGAVEQGNDVIVPNQNVTIDGAQAVGWFQINPTTGETVGVTEDGGHQGLFEWVAQKVIEGIIKKIVSPALGTLAGQIAGNLLKSALFNALDNKPNASEIQGPLSEFLTGVKEGLIRLAGIVNFALPGFGPAFVAALRDTLGPPGSYYRVLLGNEPPVGDLLFGEARTPLPPTNATAGQVSVATAVPRGLFSGELETQGFAASGNLQTSWISSTASGFLVRSASVSDATLRNGNGAVIGSGQAEVDQAGTLGVTVTGGDEYNLSGQGIMSLYGPSEATLGASGDLQNYTATITGNVSITLTVPAGALTLNGQALPAGTYTITTNSATLSGSGTMSSPNFAGTALITATTGTINLGPGSGTLSVGGKRLNSDDETTLDGYTGTISVSANGDGTDSVALNGNAGNVLQVTTTPTTLTTDQNTPIIFATNVQTSLADTYTLTANAPPGWTVSFDSSGNVIATPAPGLQSGTYPIQIIAQSQTDPNLIAQTIVDVTIKPTQPGINFTVASDPQFTVPSNGAQLPTAFRATIQNLGPVADTYNLTFSNIPTGFTLLNSGTSVTVPAGETGILGIYLQPNPGQPIPAPGTQLSFTVTATSTTDSSITETQTETFTVPAIDAVTVTASPTAVSTTPGVAATDTLTFTNAGNVPENLVPATPTAATAMGLSVSGLAPVSLAIGQSTTETVTLTPDASTPLNSMLDATITVTFGPSASPVTQTVQIPVSVVVPGATAIANASVAAGQLGDASLADQLNDLSTALTNLVDNPTSQVYMSQSTASLSAVVNLLTTDPYLGSLAPTLTADGAALAQATTPSAIQAALARLGTDLGTVGTTLTDEAAHGFTLSLLTNSQVAQPQVPATFQLVLQNTGSQTTTYDLGISGLPSGVTAAFSKLSITLGPGQVTPGSTGVPDVTLTLTPTSTTEEAAFSFTVSATARGASEITRSATGALTARSQLVQVVSVTPSPTFTNPGGQVDVSARILNAVNKEQQAQVSYTVTDANNNVIFTSQPVSTTLNVLTTLSTVDLGNLDTTGFALGQDTINVTVDESSGNPIPGATGTGSLLIGTPVTATLTTSPATLPPGNGTVTTTLDLDASNPPGGPLDLIGQAAVTGGAGSVALNGNYAYVVGADGVAVFDVSNPSSPVLLTTVGASDIPAGSNGYHARILGNDLVVVTVAVNNSALLVFSLADPSAPQFLGSTPFGALVGGDGCFVIQNGHAFADDWYFEYGVGGVLDSFGDLTSIDLSNLSSPQVAGALYGGAGSSSFEFGVAAVGTNALLVAGTTGSDLASGTGRIQVVDTSDPANPTVTGELDIPGTTEALEIAVQGNRALVISSTGGLSFNSLSDYGFTGSLVLSTLDISDPTSPTLIGSLVLSTPASALFSYTTQLAQIPSLIPIGSNLYIASGGGGIGNTPELVLINDADPANPSFTPINAPSVVTDFALSGNDLYTASPSGLLIYDLTSQSLPVMAQVTVPTNGGVSIVPNSFNIAPTMITTGPSSETLEWDLALTSAETSQTFTWQESVTGLRAGESLPVAQDASVEFTNQGMLGSSSGATAGVTVGGTLSVSVDDSPIGTNFTQNVTLSPGTTTLDQGEMTLTQSLFSSGPNAQWLVLDFEATGGRLIAGNLSGSWMIGADLPLSAPGGFTGVFAYWSVNEAPTNPITPIGVGFGSFVGTNPVDPSLSPVYVQIFPASIKNSDPNTNVLELPNLLYFSPYSLFVSRGGMDLNADNGFVIGLQVTNSSPTTSTLTLPDQFVAGDQIIGLSPTTQTVAPGAPASYNVTLSNPTSSPVTYDLTVQGVAAGWVSLESSVTVAADGSVDVPLVLTSDSFSALSDYGFSVSASGTNGATASVQGDLVLQGQPVPPDPNSHGIVATLTPALAAAGQGTSAHYIVQLTNTGSADDTFALTAAGLPPGVAASFSQTSIDVPRGSAISGTSR